MRCDTFASWHGALWRALKLVWVGRAAVIDEE